jgi:hypothetical protein
MRSADWLASARAVHGRVTVLRVDDEPGVVADRNWPSGVLRTQDIPQAPLRSGAAEPGGPGITLLQVQEPHKHSAAPCGSSAGHLEPLVPACAVFAQCAGVSHPLFPGQPAAWLPFLPHRAETCFATPYYDGLINYSLDCVNWARAPPQSALLDASEPFVPNPIYAVLRAGSVVKFRVDAHSKADSQATTSDTRTYVSSTTPHSSL